MSARPLPAIFEALSEPAFLVTTRGLVLQANKAARQEHGIPETGGADLTGLATEPAEKILEYLRRCSGSVDGLPGVLTLAGGRCIKYRTWGNVVAPGGENAPATILLRCFPGEGEFKVLTDNVEELNREVHLRRRTQMRLEQALADKEMLIRELHHRVKNNLQILLSLLQLSERAEADDRVHGKLRDARLRVQSMAAVQKLLYQAESFAAVNVANFVSELCTGLSSAFAMPDVEIRVSAAPATLSLEAAIPVGLIVNELVSNALKHAYPGSAAGEIRVRLSKEDGTFRLTVEDDGVGFEAETVRGGSSGLSLVRGLAQQLRGSATLESARPTRWRVEFSDPGRSADRERAP